nr:protein PHOSPHATE STARVATION RESPONSE 3-like isoform X1 [Ipomoea batatas]
MSTPRRNENNGQEVKQAFSGVRKPRFKWTLQVHQRFVDAVNQLGGRYKATPKNIMTLMDIEQITTDHIKSHLQKYRHNGPKQANTNTRKSKKCCFHEFFCDKRNSISTTSSRTQVRHNTGIAYNGVMSDVPEISTERHRTSQTKLENLCTIARQSTFIFGSGFSQVFGSYPSRLDIPQQFERTQQQVKYIEREYQGTPEQSSKDNEERQYPQVEEMELTTEQLEEQRKMAQKDHISVVMNSYPYKRWLEAHKEKGKFPYTSARTDEKKRFDAAPLEIISLQMEKGRTSSGFSADETLHERGKCYQVYASPASAAQIEGQNMVAEDNKTKMSNFPSYKDLKAMNASNEKSFDLNMPAKEQEE